MTQHYCVAEHLFALTMAESNMLWSQLTNYAPFATRSNETPLFELTVAEGATPLFQEQQARHILTDSSDEDMPRIELYEQGDYMLFRISMWRNAPICFEMQACRDYSKAKVVILSDCGRFPIDNALMLLYAFRTASLQTLEMHASVIVKEGKAHIFLGKSGTGKSTHSRQWLAAYPDATLLNDDNPIVRFLPSGEVVCYGSPWSGKTPCYQNLSAPVAGIVLLRQAPENHVQTLSLPESYAAVYSSSSGLRCNSQMADGLHNTVVSIITAVPVMLLDCLPNTDAAHVCYNALH